MKWTVLNYRETKKISWYLVSRNLIQFYQFIFTPQWWCIAELSRDFFQYWPFDNKQQRTGNCYVRGMVWCGFFQVSDLPFPVGMHKKSKTERVIPFHLSKKACISMQQKCCFVKEKTATARATIHTYLLGFLFWVLTLPRCIFYLVPLSQTDLGPCWFWI